MTVAAGLLVWGQAQPSGAATAAAAPVVAAPYAAGARFAAAASAQSAPVAPAKTESWTPSSHSVTADGTTTVDLFAQPAFRRTTSGWKPVDGTITAGSGTHPYEALGLVNPVHFGLTADDLFTIDTLAGPLSFGLQGASVSAPTLQGQVLTYYNVFAGVDLQLSTVGDRVSKKLVLHDTSAARSFQFTITDPHHSLGRAVQGKDESWTFSDATAFGTGIELPAPLAWEQGSAVSVGVPGSAHQKVSTVPGGYRVDLSLDAGWARTASFPVVLDPAVQWTDETWYQSSGLQVAYGPTGSTICNNGPCQLADPVNGQVVIGNPESDDPDLGEYLTYVAGDMSSLAGRQVSSSILGGWEYTAKPVVNDACATMGANSTGADLLQATCGQRQTAKINFGSEQGWHADVTDAVRAAVAGKSPTGSVAAFVVGDDDLYVYTDVNGQQVRVRDGDQISSPHLELVYTGYPVPRPLTKAQTFGCACWAGTATTHQDAGGDPVNTATGSLLEQFTDLALASPGPTLQLDRAYNSLDTTDGPFGPGWTYAYGASLTQADDGTITFRDGTGTQSRFAAVLGGGYAPLDPAVSATLTDGANGTRVMRNLSGTTMTFDTSGRLVGTADAHGQALTFTYAGTELTSISDGVGQSLALAWDTAGTHITSVTSSDGRTVSYAYTATAGATRLTGVTGVDNTTTTYAYDTATGGLSQITDPLGHRWARNTYDKTTKRITSQLDQKGAKTTFGWNASTQTATVTDPTGHVRTDVYDGLNLVKQIDGNGTATQQFYDGDDNMAASTDGTDKLFITEYDNRDRLVARTAPAPLYYTERWTYDDADRVTSYQDAAGATTHYTYDDAGMLTGQTFADGTTTSFTYTTGTGGVPAHLLATSTDQLGRTTTYAYNATGDLTSQTTPGGRTTTYTYDAAHRMLTQTTPGGRTTTNTYDAAGRLLTTTDPTGATTTNTYDAAGRLTRTTDPANHYQIYTYDMANRLTEVRYSSGRVTTTSYDGADRVATTTDGLGNVTAYTYDNAGRLVSTTDPLGHVTTNTYDAAGHMVSQTDATGATTTFGYDPLGRQTTVTDPDGVVQSTAYNERGQVSSLTNSLGGGKQMYYDALGRLTTTSDSDGVTTSNQYDAAGQLTASIKARSTDTYVPDYWQDTTTYTYDTDGRQTSVVDPRGNVPGANPSDYTTTYSYDDDNNLLTVTDPLGHTTTTTYDGDARPLTVTDAAGHVTKTAYDVLGQVTSVTDPTGAVTSYAYDGYGNLTRRKDALGHATTYTYDLAGHPLTATDPLGHITTATYDADGNTSTVATTSGTTAPITSTGTTTYSYDAANRLTARSYSDGTPAYQAQYTAAGRLHQISRVSGQTTTTATTYTYDAAGRPTKVATTGLGAATTTYSYTNAGRQAGVGYSTGIAVAYTYDGDGQLATATPTGSGSLPQISYGYDPTGHLTSITRGTGANATATQATYDDAGQLATLTHTGAQATIVGYQITRDGVGNPTTITANGAVNATTVYGYDAANRLTSVCAPASGTTCITGSPKTVLGYDKVGNRTSAAVTTVTSGTSTTTTTKSTYDADDELTSSTVGTNTVASYTWDLNGRQTGQTTPAGTRTSGYDLAAELTSVGLEDGTQVAYTYDAAGNQASRSVNGTTDATWTWTTTNGLAQRTSQTNSAGQTTNTWLPDPTSNLGAPLADITATTSSWLLPDALGTIATTTSTTGANLNGQRSLDPFGAATSSPTGTLTAEPIGYQSQYTDTTTGWLNVRARTYNPTTARFTAPDPIKPATGTAATNLYSYALSNPLVGTDPTGQYYCALFGRQCVGRERQMDDFVFRDENNNYIPAEALKAYGEGVANFFADTVNLFIMWGTAQFPQQGKLIPHVPTFGKMSCSIYGPSQLIGNLLGPQLLIGAGNAAATEGVDAVGQGVDAAAARAVAANTAARGGVGPVLVGQAGEAAVRSVYNIGPKATVVIGGRTRILDGLNAQAVTEVKNVAYQAYTQQLKDSLAYAQQNGLRFDLYVRGGANPTTLSGPLEAAVRSGDITLKAIP